MASQSRTKTGPDTEERVATVGVAGHPNLAREFADLDRSAPGEPMLWPDTDDQLALDQRRQLECRRFGVRRANGLRAPT